MNDKTFIPGHNIGDKERKEKPSYELISVPDYLDFQKVEVTEVDETKPWKPAIKVKVTKKDGETIEIDAKTPFFVFKNKEGKELTVSAATAGHIDSLHIKGADAGSLFDEPSIQALMQDTAKKIPPDITSQPGISAFDIEMGKSMGKEGIASLVELQSSGVLTKEDIDLFMALKDTVAYLNRSGSKEQKEAFVVQHSTGKVKFQLIRGDVLVPVVDTPKKSTTKLFMVFGPGEDPNRKTMYTAAPGRNMPRHPNPSQHMKDGVVDEETFKESANAWFNTVMLVGNGNKNESEFSIGYTAQFVQNIQDLINKFPPKHKKVFGHHSTIAYKPANLDGIEVGKESLIKIIGRVSDEQGDALLVENPKSNKKHPHITLSCADGVPEVYSDELIEKAISAGAVEYFPEPFEVKVIEGYSDGKNDIIKTG